MERDLVQAIKSLGFFLVYFGFVLEIELGALSLPDEPACYSSLLVILFYCEARSCTGWPSACGQSSYLRFLHARITSVNLCVPLCPLVLFSVFLEQGYSLMVEDYET